MNVFIIIALIIMVYATINYRKAFFIYLVFGLFLNQNINLINIPGIPLLTLNTSLILFFIIFYFKDRKNIVIDTTPFPLKRVFIFCSVSYIISMVFSIAGINNSFTAVFKIIIEDYLYIWLIWILIKDMEDVKFILKLLTIAFLLICIYGFYEFKVHSNPLAEYEVSIAGSGNRVLNWSYDEDVIRGYRIKSVFFHAIGGGINFSIFGLLIIYLYSLYKKRYKLKTIHILIALLCITCMFLTNSRGPIIFLFIGLLPMINPKSKYFYLSMLLLVGGLIYYKNMLLPYFTNIISVFNARASEQVGGSNIETRLDQLYAALAIFKGSPIWGLGPKAIEFYQNSFLVERLLGLESVWFWVIIERGILGIISYTYLMYALIIKLGYKNKNKYIFFISLAFLIASSVTSTPGMLNYLFYLVVFILIKTNRWVNGKYK